MTTRECLLLRKRDNFVSPFPPLERGEMLLTYMTRGGYEWLVHEDDADTLLQQGVKVDGERYDVKIGQSWPYMNAVMVIACSKTNHEHTQPGEA